MLRLHCFLNYHRRHTQYYHIQDPRRLTTRQQAIWERARKSFELFTLPELAGLAFGNSEYLQYDLLELFRNRASNSETWVAEDVSLIVPTS